MMKYMLYQQLEVALRERITKSYFHVNYVLLFKQASKEWEMIEYQIVK